MTTQQHDNERKNKNSKLSYFVISLFRRFVDRKGFTIAELIIVTTIMAVLMSIGGRIYFDERDRFEFNNAFVEMMGVIKTARNYATTSQSYHIDGMNVIPIDGYGVNINFEPEEDEPNFKLFANLGPGPLYEDYQNDDFPNRFYNDNNDKVMETYTLPKQVIFRSFYFDEEEQWDEEEEEPTATEAIIIFKPPMGDAFLGDKNENPMEELLIKFINPDAEEESPKKCVFLRINRIKTFPEIMYSGYDNDGECEKIAN